MKKIALLPLLISELIFANEVYLLSEIETVTSQFGVANDYVPETYQNYWVGDFEIYYEVQVWSNSVLSKYSDNYWKIIRR